MLTLVGEHPHLAHLLAQGQCNFCGVKYNAVLLSPMVDPLAEHDSLEICVQVRLLYTLVGLCRCSVGRELQQVNGGRSEWQPINWLVVACCDGISDRCCSWHAPTLFSRVAFVLAQEHYSHAHTSSKSMALAYSITSMVFAGGL